MCLPLLIICLPGWVLVVGFPAGLSPTSFHMSPTSFHLSPWVLVVGFAAGLSPTCIHLSPTSFHLSPTSFHLSPSSFNLSPRLVSGGLWSGFRLACLPLPFSLPGWVLVALACLPLPVICLPLLFICLPGWVLVVGFPAGLSPTSFHLSPTSFHFWSPRLGACGRVPGWLVFLSHFFICFPLLIICLPGWVLVVGFPAGLSPTSFHMSPTSFHLSPWVLVVGFAAGLSPTCIHLSPTSFHLSPSSFNLSPRLGACGRVSGWLVSHFLSVCQVFFSFVSQAGCLWSGSRLACLPLPFICLPLLFICLPLLSFVSQFFSFVSSSFHFWSPRLGACGRVSGWLVSHFHFSLPRSSFHLSPRLSFVGFPAGLSPTSFHLSPSSFHCVPGWVLVVGFAAGLSPTSFHLSPTSFHLSPTSFHLSPTSYHFWSPRLGACGRVPGWLVSHFPFVSYFFSLVSFPFICRVPGRLVSHFLSHFFSFVSQFFSLSPRLGACGRGFAAGLSPTSFHLSPTSFHLSPTSFHLSPTSYHLSPRLGACGRVSGWLVSHFLSYVSHFFSFVSLGACGRVCGWLVSHVHSFVSHFFHLSPSSFHLSPTSFHSPNSLLLGVLNALKNGRLGAGWSGRVPSRLVSHFLCLPVLFSRGSRLACLPLPFICLPILFICLPGHFVPLLFIVSQAGCLWSGFGPACLPLPFICLPLLFICLPGWVLVVGFLAGLSPTSFHLPPRLGRLGACGRVHFLSFVSQAWCLWSGSRPACLPLPFICLPLLFCLWSGSRPACLPLPLICLPLLFICHPLLFICLPEMLHLSPRSVMPCSISIHLSLSLLTSALFRWPCSISIHLSPRLVTGGVRPFPLFLFICLPGLSL